MSVRSAERGIPIRAEVENIGGSPAVPRCFYTDRRVGLVQIRKPTGLVQPGERVPLIGTARFPIPVFNYECDDMCIGLECFPRDGVPPGIQYDLDTYAKIPAEGEPVVVPEVDGVHLYQVGWQLFRRGLRVRFSREMKQDRSPKAWKGILYSLAMSLGPRVSVSPPPGTVIDSGSVVTLRRLTEAE